MEVRQLDVKNSPEASKKLMQTLVKKSNGAKTPPLTKAAAPWRQQTAAKAHAHQKGEKTLKNMRGKSAYLPPAVQAGKIMVAGPRGTVDAFCPLRPSS